MTDITQEQITRFDEAKRRFESFQKPQATFGMRPILNEVEKNFLDAMMQEVHLGVILDHIAASTYEAADSVGADSEGGLWLVQQASVCSAAALFCKTWEPNK